MINASEIRAWARENEIPVGTRGRLDPEVKAAYIAANHSVARTFATDKGLSVPARGRLSEDTVLSITALLP